ncbi:MAG: hypothetical protein WA021_01450 [Minisyncoccia bacterium]
MSVTVDGKYVVWANDASAAGHTDLVASLEAKMGKKVDCLGGGTLHLSLRKHKIYIWDYSATYGSDDKRQTAIALKQVFPKYQIVLENPDTEKWYLRRDELESSS